MKRNIYFPGLVCLITLFHSSAAFSQDDDAPVLPAFETINLIDNQTTMNPYKGSVTLQIQHRFSQISEIDDLYGIFGSANSRLGVSYGVTDKIMVGFGTTRDSKLQDLEWKLSLLTQTESKIPVSLSYHGNAVLDARGDEFFGPEQEYRFIRQNVLPEPADRLKKIWGENQFSTCTNVCIFQFCT